MIFPLATGTLDLDQELSLPFFVQIGILAIVQNWWPQTFSKNLLPIKRMSGGQSQSTALSIIIQAVILN